VRTLLNFQKKEEKNGHVTKFFDYFFTFTKDLAQLCFTQWKNRPKVLNESEHMNRTKKKQVNAKRRSRLQLRENVVPVLL
jgi:hypothetical protein